MANFKTTTIKQVAARAGVSTATVSRVLSGNGSVKSDTRSKVLAAIDTLEYATRQNKKCSPRTILASFPDLINPFYNDVIQGIRQAAVQGNYKVVFYVMENYFADSSYGFFESSNFYDGLLLAHNVPNSAILSRLSARLPVVMCSEHVSGNVVSYVAIDDFVSAQKAMKYLFRLGRNKIALVNSSLSNNYAIHRERAYRHCLEKEGISINENWIINLPSINYDLAVGAVTNLLKKQNIPDAFFCVSDVYAAAAIKAAEQLSFSVPEDIAVIGFDDIDITTMTSPQITTIHQPKYQMGWQSCSLLIDQIEHPSMQTRQIILNTDLIVRSST